MIRIEFCLFLSSLWVNNVFTFIIDRTDYQRVTSTFLFSYNEDSKRAGSGGFSVLRQPLNWNPDEVPNFEAPSSLREEDKVRENIDWLSDRSNHSKNSKKSTTATQQIGLSKPAETSDDLDLFKRTLDTLDYPIVLDALQAECVTLPGRDIVKSQQQPVSTEKTKSKNLDEMQYAYRLLSATSHNGILERYKAVEEMGILMDWHSELLNDAYYRNRQGYRENLRGPPIAHISFNLKDIMQIADGGNVLEGPEILETVTIIDALNDIQLWGYGLEKVKTESVEFIELPKITKCIAVNNTLQELLHNAFDKDGRLNGKTFPLIGELRAKIRMVKNAILGTLDSLLSDPSILSKLALESGGPKYSEVNGRIVIPVHEKYQKDSLGIVHDFSRSGKTVYVEPTQIVSQSNELFQVETELRMEEQRVWRDLTEQILQNRVELEAAVAVVGQLDLVIARIALGKKWDGVIPTVGCEGVISLRDAKHPVLLLRKLDNIVGSDVDIGVDGNQGLVLTGPNSGGKTVILKLLGLMALMVRIGIPIPASEKSHVHSPRVDFFHPVLADIGDLQSVGGDLSTFSGHMLVCREVLASSGKNALVLMDELGSGTDPAQGVAIAQAVLEALVEIGARCAITTHYIQLKQLAASDSRFNVGAMQFVNGRPTYSLLMGAVGESFALAVAERFQLPQKVLDRAYNLLDQDTRRMGDLIRDLEDQKVLVDAQVEELERKKREMERLEQHMKKQREKLEVKQLSARRDEAKKFAKKLEEKEKVLEDILDKLKKDPSRRLVAKSWDNIKFTKRDALNEAENVPSVMKSNAAKTSAQEELYAELIPIAEMQEKPIIQHGDKLQLCLKGPVFGKEVEVVQISRNKLKVRNGAMLMQVRMTEVALPNSKVQEKYPKSNGNNDFRSRNARFAERALLEERRNKNVGTESKETVAVDRKKKNDITMRTSSNTVDVRGCNLEDAKLKIVSKFDIAIRSNRFVIFILHGYGERGTLRTKIRNWLKSERQLVHKWKSADSSDGGDSFTKVELKR